MNYNVAHMMKWVEFFLFMAAITTTAFPVLYAFSPWYKSLLGRLIMTQATTLAVAMNLTLYFHFWTPTDIRVALLINIIVVAAIGITSGLLTWMLWTVAHKNNARSNL